MSCLTNTTLSFLAPFSFMWAEAMLVFRNKRKSLHRKRTQFSEAAVRSRKNPHPSGDFLKNFKCFKLCSQNWKSFFTTEVDKLKVNINKIEACQRLFSLFFPTTRWKYKRNIFVWQQRYAALLKWACLMLMLGPRKLDIHNTH